MNTQEELYISEMNKVEALVRKLLQDTPTTPQGLWQFQIELVEHQIAIQEQISLEEAKRGDLKVRLQIIHRDHEGNWKENLQDVQDRLQAVNDSIEIYKYVRNLSRQVGDTLAWLAFGHDERKIWPLTVNSPSLPVSPISRGYSIKGVIKVAEIMENSGAGFPMIHDVTTCLRVGDITFISPDDTFTIEVKTSFVETEDSLPIINLRIFGRPEDEGKFQTISNNMTDILGVVPSKVKRVNPLGDLLTRQLNRMSTARTFQIAEFEIPFTVDEKTHIVVGLEPSTVPDHWAKIRELATVAKVNGFASEVVDDAIYYGVSYKSNALEVSLLATSLNTMLPLDILQADFQIKTPLCEDKEQDLFVTSINWSYHFGDVSPKFRPFFLHPLPLDMIIDVMWRRLTFVVQINIGKLVEAINQTHLDAYLPNENEYKRVFIPVTQEFKRPDGTIGKLDLGSLHKQRDTLLYEYLSVSGFINTIVLMAEVIERAVLADWEKRQADD